MKVQLIHNVTDIEIKKASQSLFNGNLVAFPTETVYGLGADATNKKAVERIYEVKNRPLDHPLIVHISSLKLFKLWATSIPDYLLKLSKNLWPGPITFVVKKSNIAKNFVTGNQDYVAIRIPNHPTALKLLQEFEKLGGKGVVAPSANRFGSVSPTSAVDVFEEIGSKLNKKDIILDGGECRIGLESTILWCVDKDIQILRHGEITKSHIEKILGFKIRINKKNSNIKHSGNLKKHYSPNTRVIVDQKPKFGDGFIALSHIPTPVGVNRLAAPKNINEFKHVLYRAMRLGDKHKVSRIVISLPKRNASTQAIIDRITRAAAT